MPAADATKRTSAAAAHATPRTVRVKRFVTSIIGMTDHRRILRGALDRATRRDPTSWLQWDASWTPIVSVDMHDVSPELALVDGALAERERDRLPEPDDCLAPLRPPRAAPVAPPPALTLLAPPPSRSPPRSSRRSRRRPPRARPLEASRRLHVAEPPAGPAPVPVEAAPASPRPRSSSPSRRPAELRVGGRVADPEAVVDVVETKPEVASDDAEPEEPSSPRRRPRAGARRPGPDARVGRVGRAAAEPSHGPEGPRAGTARRPA